MRCVTAILGLLLLASSLAARAGEQDERRTIRDEARMYYLQGDFDGLERLHRMYSDFPKQRTSSGAFKMTLFIDGFGEALKGADEAALEADIARTQQWAKDHPSSTLAHVLHADSLLRRGLRYRGSGYANEVAPQAWKYYGEYVQRAGKYLIDHEADASKDTTWHTWMLNVARLADWPDDAVQKIFEDGITKNKADYRLYRNALHYWLPKWAGNAAAVDRFIRHAAQVGPAEYGEELYARLYSGAGEDQFKRRLYADSLIEWPSMKAGLALWVQRFPTAWNRNIFAYHACMAGDKALASKLMADIANETQWEIWQPDAKATYSACARWVADPDAEPKAPTQPAAKGNPV